MQSEKPIIISAVGKEISGWEAAWILLHCLNGNFEIEKDDVPTLEEAFSNLKIGVISKIGEE